MKLLYLDFSTGETRGSSFLHFQALPRTYFQVLPGKRYLDVIVCAASQHPWRTCPLAWLEKVHEGH